MNRILFNNVLPIPLRDSPMQGNVWNSHLELDPAGHYLLQAASGKGKTTFLHILYGIRNDYTGHVSLDGRDIRSYAPDEIPILRKGTLSCLFQDLRLFGELTAEENICMKPGNKFDIDQIREWASRLGVAELLPRKCQTLSFGQQQRIACIRAISQSFAWLLLDEPFSHLDQENMQRMSALIMERCAQENAGIIVTSLGGNYGFTDFKTLNM